VICNPEALSKRKVLSLRTVLPTVHLLELVGESPFAGGLFDL
jgi:hypothetical protein